MHVTHLLLGQELQSLMPAALVAAKVKSEGLSFIRDPLLSVEFVEEFFESDEYVDMQYSKGDLSAAIKDATWHNLPLTKQMNQVLVTGDTLHKS